MSYLFLMLLLSISSFGQSLILNKSIDTARSYMLVPEVESNIINHIVIFNKSGDAKIYSERTGALIGETLDIDDFCSGATFIYFHRYHIDLDSDYEYSCSFYDVDNYHFKVIDDNKLFQEGTGIPQHYISGNSTYIKGSDTDNIKIWKYRSDLTLSLNSVETPMFEVVKSNEYLVIRSNGLLGEGVFSIVDLEGKVLVSKVVKNINKEEIITLNTSSINTGIYLLKTPLGSDIFRLIE